MRAKVAQVKAYADGAYRLETNDQLYEGVRFAWIFRYVVYEYHHVQFNIAYARSLPLIAL